jgi:hypothetical protein
MIRLYGLTVFTSAFLGFALQPMVGRMILPKFGGGPAVWNTAMVFFQATLLAGYAYVHVATTWLGLKRTVMLHLGLVIVLFAALPVVVAEDWTAPTESNPIPSLLGCLALSAGLPFLVVSTGAPLLQKWFTATAAAQSRDPYLLYAASNAGSLAGLLSYPVVIEPILGLREQSWFWSAGYALLAALTSGCAIAVWRSRGTAPLSLGPQDQIGTENPVVAIDIRTRLRWLALAFVPSSLLMGVTTRITTDISPIPLLWVVPLSLYLLTFMVAFARPPSWLQRWLLWCLPFCIVAPLAMPFIPGEWRRLLSLNIPVYLVSFAAVSLAFHGELARRKPPAAASTEFYLWIALGGVLGGSFNALLAPMVFSSPLEYELVLILAALIMPPWQSCWPWLAMRWRELAAVGLVAILALSLWCQGLAPFWKYGLPLVGCSLVLLRPVVFGVGTALIFGATLSVTVANGSQECYRARSFFGTMRVVGDAGGHVRLLYHGSTIHGGQWRDAQYRRTPLLYFDPESAIAQVFGMLRGEGFKKKLDPVAVCGLGAGTLAAFGRKDEEVTFFEIDPEMEYVARTQFTYLQDSEARCNVVIGDARLSMTREPAGRYGLIVLDAFSSDSVPTHLLTSEAIAMYRDKLTEHGIIAVHITNRYLDLEPVVFALAEANSLVARACFDNVGTQAAIARGKRITRWVILARHHEDFGVLSHDPRWRSVCRTKVRPWTDDYSNVIGALDLRFGLD